MIALPSATPIALPDSSDQPHATPKGASVFGEALNSLLGKIKKAAQEDEPKAVPKLLIDLSAPLHMLAQRSEAQSKLVATALKQPTAAPLAEVTGQSIDDEPELTHQALTEAVAKADTGKVEHTNVVAHPTPVFKSELVDAIAKHVVKETPRVEITVQPPELGRVHVSVEMRQNEVHVRVSAETNEVAKSLESRLPELQQTLREQGMRVGSIDVDMQLRADTSSEFSNGGDRSSAQSDRDSGEPQQQRESSIAPSRRVTRKLDVVA